MLIDSEATIPGRPPLHERSSSAPSWRNFTVNDSDIPRVSPLDTRQRKGRNPLLAKTLTPLVIPASGPNVSHLRTCSLDAVDVPPQVPPKSARHGEGASPMRRGLETPPSAWSTTTYTTTPFSAMGGWEPSKPWATPITGNSPIEARRRPSETSISNRGRPIKRSNGTLKHQGNNTNKRSPSAEERAFQTLPVGFRPMEAVSRLTRQEIEELQQQAISQVDRYAVLSMKDVQSLSKVWVR